MRPRRRLEICRQNGAAQGMVDIVATGVRGGATSGRKLAGAQIVHRVGLLSLSSASIIHYPARRSCRAVG